MSSVCWWLDHVCLTSFSISRTEKRVLAQGLIPNCVMVTSWQYCLFSTSKVRSDPSKCRWCPPNGFSNLFRSIPWSTVKCRRHVQEEEYRNTRSTLALLMSETTFRTHCLSGMMSTVSRLCWWKSTQNIPHKIATDDFF